MTTAEQTHNNESAIPRLTLEQFGGDDIGKSEMVNLFRGNLSFPLEVTALPGSNGLDCKITMLYESNAQFSVEKWNQDKPTGIVGMGWSIPYERIVISAKRNGSKLDDNYYMITEGATQKLVAIPRSWTIGLLTSDVVQSLLRNRSSDNIVQEQWQNFNRKLSTSTRIEQQDDSSYLLYDDGNERVYNLRMTDNGQYELTTAGQSFELENFQYWQISYYQEYQRWEIIKEDGTICTYGSNLVEKNANTLQYGVKWNNWVGDTCEAKGEQTITAWNLAKVENIYGNHYLYDYQVQKQTVGNGADSLFYTKECHVRKISNDLGWSLQYIYDNKVYDDSELTAPKEYLDPHKNPSQPAETADAFQSQYDTLFLSEIGLFNANQTTISRVEFDYYELQNLTPEPSSNAKPLAKLAYGACYKRYLKGIKQYFQQDVTKPGIQFTYNFTKDTNQNRGVLTEILYPEGGKFTANYKEIMVGDGAENEQQGARNKSIDNPFGADKEDKPRVWFGENYIVSAWYSEDESRLMVNVFTWLGTWYQSTEQWFIFDESIDIDKLQIATSDNSFLMAMSQSYVNSVYLFNRSHLRQGNWEIQQQENEYQSHEYGSETLHISNGDDFFIVNGVDNNEDKVIDRYGWNRNNQSWEVSSLTDDPQLCPEGSTASQVEYYTTASSNYYVILCHDQTQEPPSSKLVIDYQSSSLKDDETLDWHRGGTLDTSAISIPSSRNTSYFNFAPAESFAAMSYITDYIGNSNMTTFNYALQILTWNEDFKQLALAKIDNVCLNNFTSIPAPIQGALGPQVVDNTLVGSGPNVYYFDGIKWQHKYVDIKFDSQFSNPSVQYYWYEYTADSILKSENTDSGIFVELSYLNKNDTTAAWQSIVLEDSEHESESLRQNKAYPSLTSTYCTYGSKVYNRGVYNEWKDPKDQNIINEDFLLTDFSQLPALQGLTINTSTIINQAPYFIAFMTVDEEGLPTATYIAFLRNGDFIRGSDGHPVLEQFEKQQVTTLLDKQYHYQQSLNGKLPAIPMGFVTYAIKANPNASKQITLHRYANESTQKPISAYVVDNIKIETGYDTQNKCYQYSDQSAAQDATGTIIKFQTVTEYSGCLKSNDQQNGYIVSKFFNGLPQGKDEFLHPVDNDIANQHYTMLDGQLWSKQQYNASGTLISSDISSWRVQTKIAIDALDSKLRALYGGIPQIYQSASMQDGVATINRIEYALASGNPKKTSFNYFSSTGEELTQQTLTDYAYEKYVGMWQQNLLKPVVQTQVQAKDAVAHDFELLSANAYTWKQWQCDDNQYWAENATYVATQDNVGNFPYWDEPQSDDKWLKTNNILSRNAMGGIVEQSNANQVKSTIIYDDDQRFSLASFNNAGIEENGVSYDSFEDYQTTQWVFTQGQGTPVSENNGIITTDSFSGFNSFNLTSSGILRKTITLSALTQDYVFSGWFKTTPSASTYQMTMALSDASSNQVSKSINIVPDGKWQYVQWVVNPDDSSLSGSEIQLDIRTDFNTADTFIRIDSLLWMPLNSDVKADVYDLNLLLPTAKLTANGRCEKTFYDLCYNAISHTGVDQNTLNINADFMARQITEIDDDIDFPIHTPNFDLVIDAQDMGFYDQFNIDALQDYTFVNCGVDDWQVTKRKLQLQNTNSATLGAQIQRKDFAADSLAVNVIVNSDSSNTVSLGTGKIYVIWNSSKWLLVEDNAGTLTELQTVEDVDFQAQWLLTVFDDRVLFYANGICLFNYQSSGLQQNQVLLGMQKPGSFSAIQVCENIALSLSYKDGLSKERQTIQMESSDSVILTATLYDNIGRAAIMVKPSRVTSKDVINPFSYHTDYVTNGGCNDSIWLGSPITGDVVKYHSDAEGYPFSRTVFEPSPIQRPVQLGKPGKGFAITNTGNNHITTMEYGNNKNDPGFFYPLPIGQYFITKTTDPDGNITTRYVDVLNHKKNQKNQDSEQEPSYLGVIQQNPDATADIKYSWAYDRKSQVIASLPPKYYAERASGHNTEVMPTLASTYCYDFLGRQISSFSPDVGKSLYIYDHLDQLRFIQSATAAEKNYLNYFKYDQQQRIIEKGSDESSWDEELLQERANNSPQLPLIEDTWCSKYLFDGNDDTVNMIGMLWQAVSNNRDTSEDVATCTKHWFDGDGRKHWFGDDGRMTNMLDKLWKTISNNRDTFRGDIYESYNYNRMGNATQCQQILTEPENCTYVIDYTYNSAGCLLTTTDSVTNLTVAHTYNPLGQLIRVDSKTPQSESRRLANYSYTQEGDLAQVGLLPVNNTAMATRDFSYLPTGWISNINDDCIDQTLQYTEAGCDGDGYYTGAIAKQSVQYKKGVQQDDDRCFTVDYLNRIESAKNSSTTDQWSMDANGNFESHAINDAIHSYTTKTDSNRLASIQGDTFNRTLTYTENGEVDTITDGNGTQMQFAYSRGNGLTNTISLPGNNTHDQVDYHYNANNQRVIKQVTLDQDSVLQRTYIHGLANNPIVEIDKVDGKNKIKRYIHLPGCTVIYYDNQYFVALKDHLGSTRMLLDEHNNVVGQYNYDVYGTPEIIKSPQFMFDYLYTGQEYEPQTGLYNYKSRLYDPMIGRFIMIDPEMEFFSPYVYAGNNPLIFVDPNGKEVFLAILAIGALIGAAIGGATAAYQGVKANKTGWDLVGYIATGTAIGAVGGAASAAGGVGAFAAGSAAVSATGSTAAGVVAGAAFGSASTSLLSASSNTLNFLNNQAFGVKNSGTIGDAALQGASIGAVVGAVGGGLVGHGGSIAQLTALRSSLSYNYRSLGQVCEALNIYSEMTVLPLPSLFTKNQKVLKGALFLTSRSKLNTALTSTTDYYTTNAVTPSEPA
ncbi:RHS repeat-associated core domain-containing protein [Moritella sp. 28]|uniref:RHS repeat-associated core domain-containing protein n=1 Tax=Moritella sp. 28 TaxID=2746232 RepID=UPI001BA6992D|nr:RHS repeat-associated core domain-containing protein [Moritella sp. 28]QUM85219.1 RHS repeat-associated core domain-containing protein [Moritella sp. 28]